MYIIAFHGQKYCNFFLEVVINKVFIIKKGCKMSLYLKAVSDMHLIPLIRWHLNVFASGLKSL